MPHFQLVIDKDKHLCTLSVLERVFTPISLCYCASFQINLLVLRVIVDVSWDLAVSTAKYLVLYQTLRYALK